MEFELAEALSMASLPPDSPSGVIQPQRVQLTPSLWLPLSGPKKIGVRRQSSPFRKDDVLNPSFFATCVTLCSQGKKV